MAYNLNRGLVDPMLDPLFLDIPREELRRLEETAKQRQAESLSVERLVSRQSSTPSVKFEFGSSFKLPVKETDDLRDAWDEKNFTDKILNNWSFTVSLDLSSLFSPLNKK